MQNSLTSHFAQWSGVKTAPTGLSAKLEFRVSTVFESFYGLNPALRVAPNTLIMFDGKVGEEIVKAVDVTTPLNLLPHLINRIVEAHLASAKILNAICVHWQASEGSNTDIFQIACFKIRSRLVVTKLCNNELASVVREELEQVANGANAAIRVFRAV